MKPQTGSTKRIKQALGPLKGSYRGKVLRASTLVLLLAVALPGCTTAGHPTASPTNPDSSSLAPPAIRQTDDAGRSLPFKTEFSNRWSINNNGTPYEPCTQVTRDQVDQFQLDAGSIRDAAASDFQTARGCTWTFRDDGRSFLTQAVGNMTEPEQGLDGHKQVNSGGITWYSDVILSGRRVILGSINPSDCGAYVRSGDAVVGTSITRFGRDRPPTSDICKAALNFLQSTMVSIPN